MRERVVLVSYDVLVFWHPRYPSASPHVLASLETPICEVSKWQCVVKSRLIDEILSEDPRSVMTIRFEEETQTLIPRTFLPLQEMKESGP